MAMVNFYELPQDMQEKVKELASHYPFTINEVIPYYLMGGDHADKLLELKTMGAPDVFIQMCNHEMYEEKNRGLWQDIDMHSNSLINEIARSLKLDVFLLWLNDRIFLYLEAQERMEKHLLQFLSKFRS